MKPVFQKIVNSKIGDCWRCCIASILELDADQVPNFVEGDVNPKFGDDSVDRAMRWLGERGIVLLKTRTGTPTHLFSWRTLPGAYAIASVPSQRFPGSGHAVIVQWQKDPENENITQLRVVHDPNPGNAPYPADVQISHLDFLLQLKPNVAP